MHQLVTGVQSYVHARSSVNKQWKRLTRPRFHHFRTRHTNNLAFLVFRHETPHLHRSLYIPMPPIPPIPPMPPPGIAGSSLGISVITASAVVSREATPEASVMAVRTT